MPNESTQGHRLPDVVGREDETGLFDMPPGTWRWRLNGWQGPRTMEGVLPTKYPDGPHIVTPWLHCSCPVTQGASGDGVWNWDGNEAAPTLSPSILVESHWGEAQQFLAWHGYMKAGNFIGEGAPPNVLSNYGILSIGEKTTPRHERSQRMQFIRDGKIYDTQSANKVFEEECHISGMFAPLPGMKVSMRVAARIYQTPNNHFFMTVAVLDQEQPQPEYFCSNDPASFVPLLDQAGAAPSVYTAVGIALEEA